jgi:hypothetical protein
MKKEQFDELVESVHEGGAILRAKTKQVGDATKDVGMTPDELRKLADEMDFKGTGDWPARILAAAAAWEHEHADRLKWVEAYNEVHLKWSEALRRLEAAEKDIIYLAGEVAEGSDTQVEAAVLWSKYAALAGEEP